LGVGSFFIIFAQKKLNIMQKTIFFLAIFMLLLLSGCYKESYKDDYKDFSDVPLRHVRIVVEHTHNLATNLFYVNVRFKDTRNNQILKIRNGARLTINEVEYLYTIPNFIDEYFIDRWSRSWSDTSTNNINIQLTIPRETAQGVVVDSFSTQFDIRHISIVNAPDLLQENTSYNIVWAGEPLVADEHIIVSLNAEELSTNIDSVPNTVNFMSPQVLCFESLSLSITRFQSFEQPDGLLTWEITNETSDFKNVATDGTGCQEEEVVEEEEEEEEGDE
jgi:hypothetical protein